jgi:hypothetical protein
MAKEKKKLSKSARAAAKLLENSKLLAASKTANDSKMPPTPKPLGFSAKTNAPNKMRPEKKRG